jgi:hypothetical protein
VTALCKLLTTLTDVDIGGMMVTTVMRNFITKVFESPEMFTKDHLWNQTLVV